MVSEFVKSLKTRPIRAKAAAYAIELQDLLMNDARDGEVTASVRAQIARAWVDLQEMRLRLAMKPAPKPIDTTQLQPRQRKSPGTPKPSAVAPASTSPIAPE
jgi:hypothetical protein